jgi:hypothetical protein
LEKTAYISCRCSFKKKYSLHTTIPCQTLFNFEIVCSWDFLLLSSSSCTIIMRGSGHTLFVAFFLSAPLKSSRKHSCPSLASRRAFGLRCRSRICRLARPVVSVLCQHPLLLCCLFDNRTNEQILGGLTMVVQTLGMSTIPAMWPWIGAQDRRR